MSPDAPRVFRGEDLRVGLSADFEREISEADILAFAANSGDANPLHVDAEYARGTSYGGRLVHGAFQVGLASAMIGMHLPGQFVLLASLGARFPAPLYFPCRVRVRGEITAWNAESRGGQVKVTVVETSRQVPTAEIVMGFTLHEPITQKEQVRPVAETSRSGEGRPIVLVTGASGGLGVRLVETLSERFDVLALTRSVSLPEEIRGLPGVREWRADLADANLSLGMREVLGGRSLYGIVHAAWPGAPLGGLLQAQDEVIESQILFGSTTTIRLARLLFETVGEEGGRFVAIGSVVGSQKPVITMAGYSLGKAALENAVKLLAPELARRKITINAVCPSFIPTGMNQHKTEPQRKLEAARVPLGRLCDPDDVSGAVAYLLSEGSGFLSGQVIGLTGGQL